MSFAARSHCWMCDAFPCHDFRLYYCRGVKELASLIEMIGQIQEGSLVAIHDAGAYVISMWSSHCNRRRPEVIGISKKRPPFSLFEGERREDIISRW